VEVCDDLIVQMVTSTNKRIILVVAIAVATGGGFGVAYWHGTSSARTRRAELASIKTLIDTPRVARPSLPVSERARAQDIWPSKEELGAYSLQIGVFEDVSDEDAQWLLRIARDHPDPGVRVAVVSLLCLPYGENRAGELRPSRASQATKDEIALLLIEWLSSRNADQRLAAAIAVCTGRLWRDVVFRSAIEGLRDDPDVALRRWMKLCWNEIDQAK